MRALLLLSVFAGVVCALQAHPWGDVVAAGTAEVESDTADCLSSPSVQWHRDTVQTPHSVLAAHGLLTKESSSSSMSLSQARAVLDHSLSHAAAIQQRCGHVPRSYTTPTPAAARRTAKPTATPATTINPIDFGADPTGKQDSTEAMLKAMGALLNATGKASHHMASGIVDLGGSTLDLQGGQYLISKPLVVPQFFGNLRVVRGTLRASAKFPAAQYLIHIGNASCEPDIQHSCNEFVEMSEVLFDASHVAAGGVYIANTMGSTIGPSAFFTGFTTAGVYIQEGHETMISEAWFAEYYWSDSVPANSSSIGVHINGNDHFLTDVIVFQYTHIGVQIDGAANLLQGVHTWNGGGVGIANTGNRNRFLGCYLDFNTLLFQDPSQLVVENTFFLSTNTTLVANKGSVTGLIMKFNTFTISPAIVTQGSFHSVSNAIIEDNLQTRLSTRAIKVARKTSATHFAVDFSDSLVFSKIDTIQYSVMADAAVFTPSFAHTPTNTTAIIEFQQPVTATVVVQVAQGLYHCC